jgi:hypothetical protein
MKMKKLCVGIIGMLLASGCLIQPKPSDLVFDDTVAASRSIASIASVDMGYSVSPYVADRAYVESTLAQVFDLTGSTTLETGVYQKKEFGGACDRYGANDDGAGNYAIPRAQCYTGIQVVQPSNSNPMRYSYTMKTCEVLVNTASSFNAAMLKVFPTWKTTDTLKAADAASITKAYQLFFPADAPSADLLASFQTMSKAATTTSEGWKQVLLTVCVSSPEWQVF